MKTNRARVAVVLCVGLVAGACASAQERARAALDRVKVSYDEETFVRRAAEGDLPVVRQFLLAGMRPEGKSRDGRTALVAAARAGQLQVARLLVQHGANLEARDEKFGATPLIWAAVNGNARLVHLLLAKGANVRASAQANGTTALLAAASGGHHDAVAMLLARGAAVGDADSSGRTPLIWAVRGNHREVARLLLGRGADPNVALLDAASRARPSLVKFLLDQGANVKAADTSGTTALMRAARAGNTTTVRLLLERGADANMTDREGKTAAALAKDAGKRDVEELLRSARKNGE